MEIYTLGEIIIKKQYPLETVLIQKMMPGNVGMASGLNLGFSVGLGTMGVLALGKVADLWSMPLIFDILAFLPIIALVLTWFIHEPQNENAVGVRV